MSWSEVAASALGGGVAGGGIALLLARQVGARAEEGRLAEEARRKIDHEWLLFRLALHRKRHDPHAGSGTVSPGDLGDLFSPMNNLLTATNDLPSWERRLVVEALEPLTGERWIAATQPEEIVTLVASASSSDDIYAESPLRGFPTWAAGDERWATVERLISDANKRLHRVPWLRRLRLYGA